MANLLPEQQLTQYTVATGDTFNYSPWGGLCTAIWSGEQLWMARNVDSTSGTCVWKADRNATRLLLEGAEFQLLWDNRTSLRAQMVDVNTIRVWHASTPYDFRRVPRYNFNTATESIAVAVAEAVPTEEVPPSEVPAHKTSSTDASAPVNSCTGAEAAQFLPAQFT